MTRAISAASAKANVGEVLQVMLDVHADEIFNHGVFNGAWAISLTSLHVCVYLQVGN